MKKQKKRTYCNQSLVTGLFKRVIRVVDSLSTVLTVPFKWLRTFLLQKFECFAVPNKKWSYFLVCFQKEQKKLVGAESVQNQTFVVYKNIRHFQTTFMHICISTLQKADFEHFSRQTQNHLFAHKYRWRGFETAWNGYRSNKRDL